MNNILTTSHSNLNRRTRLVQLLELQASALERLLALSAAGPRRINIAVADAVQFEAKVCRRGSAAGSTQPVRRSCRNNLNQPVTSLKGVVRSN